MNMALNTQEILDAVDTVLDDHRKRLEALETEGAVVPLLADISTHLRMMALSAMQGAGLAVVEADAEGNFSARLPSPQERELRESAPVRYTLGRTSTLPGDGGPQAWVMQPPPPYNDVEIVCVSDGESAVGMRCTAARKVRGGETRKFLVKFEEKE
jgi:hypothetical protein